MDVGRSNLACSAMRLTHAVSVAASHFSALLPERWRGKTGVSLVAPRRGRHSRERKKTIGLVKDYCADKRVAVALTAAVRPTGSGLLEAVRTRSSNSSLATRIPAGFQNRHS